MPIYEYKCKDCEKVFSKLTFNLNAKAECPECKSENTERLISTIASSSGGSNVSSCGSSGFS
jgi:putative FmdB family regulatory protein